MLTFNSRNILFHATFLLVINFPQYAGAQTSKATPSSEFTYNLGTPYEEISSDWKDYYHQENEIIAIKMFKKGRFYIQKLDGNTLQQVGVREVSDKLPVKYEFEGFCQVPGKVMFLYSQIDKASKAEQLFCRGIEFQTGDLSPEPELLLNLNKNIDGNRGEKIFIKTSADSSYLMLHYKLKPESKDDSKNHDVVGLAIYSYDTQFKPSWSKELKMPNTADKMSILKHMVDSDGNAYILAKVYPNSSSRYRFEVLKIDAKTQQLMSIQIDLKGKFIRNPVLKEGKDGQMSVNGYYNLNDKANSFVQGVFQANITKEGQLENLLAYDIPIEIINQNVGEKEASRNEHKDSKSSGGVGIEFMQLEDVEKFKDGSCILIGEQYRVFKIENNNVNPPTYYYTYNYDDVLITRINADGKLAWMRKLAKRQSGNNDGGGMSYKYFKRGDFHYLLFLDNPDNLKMANNSYPFSQEDGKAGNLTAFVINETTGATSRVAILNTGNVDGTRIHDFSPNRLMQINENELVLEVIKSKKNVLIKVSVNGALPPR